MSESTSKPCIHGHTGGRNVCGDCIECKAVSVARFVERATAGELEPCKRGHTGRRYPSGGCVECMEPMTALYRADNREERNAKGALYHAANRDKLRVIQALYNEANPHASVTHKLTKSGHCPSWADLDAIRQIYLDRDDCNNIEPGSHFEIDHRLPLNGENFSGLHVIDNLQVLTRAQNLRKGNRVLEF